MSCVVGMLAFDVFLKKVFEQGACTVRWLLVFFLDWRLKNLASDWFA